MVRSSRIWLPALVGFALGQSGWGRPASASSPAYPADAPLAIEAEAPEALPGALDDVSGERSERLVPLDEADFIAVVPTPSAAELLGRMLLTQLPPAPRSPSFSLSRVLSFRVNLPDILRKRLQYSLPWAAVKVGGVTPGKVAIRVQAYVPGSERSVESGGVGTGITGGTVTGAGDWITEFASLELEEHRVAVGAGLDGQYLGSRSLSCFPCKVARLTLATVADLSYLRSEKGFPEILTGVRAGEAAVYEEKREPRLDPRYPAGGPLLRRVSTTPYFLLYSGVKF